MVVWADFEHDDTMEVLSKECHALSDDEQDSGEEENSEVESAEDADDDDVETDFVPGHVRIVKEEEVEDEEREEDSIRSPYLGGGERGLALW